MEKLFKVKLQEIRCFSILTAMYPGAKFIPPCLQAQAGGQKGTDICGRFPVLSGGNRQMNEITRYGVAEIGIVPIREAPSDTAEMVNQLLLGETVEILSQEGVWTHIVTHFDNYRGWVSSTQIRGLAEPDFHNWVTHPERRRFPYRSTLVQSQSQHGLHVPCGAFLPVSYRGIEWFGEDFHFRSEPIRLKGNNVTDTAHSFLGVSYLWGGRTDGGIDCSGFIQTVYMLHGISLPRDSGDQFRFGEQKGTRLDEAEAGDIIYFRYKDRPVSHIGFYLGNGLLLHASAQVRIQQIDPARQSGTDYSFNQALAEGIVGIIRPYKPAPLQSILQNHETQR
jgi:gamma-D-glutamyl-L-lysine dipeptidyl-peptidase